MISAYTAPQYKNCQFTPNLTFAIDNCLDSRNSINNANNFDFRVDHHFSEKNIVFGRAYMMWDTNNGIVAGTTSITPSPFHTWNIGGAWDHIFTPNLILELRGGINARPVMVNPTNPDGYTPETAAGFSNLDATAGFFLNVGGYIGSANSGIGNVGPQHRANPEHNFSGAMTWTHGKHTVRFGGEYLYENRLEINTYETFTSSTTQTCPTNASGLFACGSNQGNALASMLLDLPSGLTVNVPQYEEVHVRMAPFGFFVQDEWHVRSEPDHQRRAALRLRPGGPDSDHQRRDRQRSEPARPAVHHRSRRRVRRYTDRVRFAAVAAVRSRRPDQREPGVQCDGRRRHLQHAQ